MPCTKFAAAFCTCHKYADNFRFEFQRLARQRMIEVEQGIVFVDIAQGAGKMSAAECAVGSLFRRFAIKVFVVGLRFGSGMVDNTISMIRG